MPKNAKLTAVENPDAWIEKTAVSEDIYEGKVLHFFRDTVSLPGGGESFREYVKHRGAVAVVALDGNGNVYLVRQYRYAIGRLTVEIPAGKLEPGEADPCAAAMRELKEEIGATAGKVTPLGVYLSSPAILTERIYCYLAEELTFGETHFDEDENLATVCLPLTDAIDRVLSGEIEDGKTLFALQKVYLMKQKEAQAERK